MRHHDPVRIQGYCQGCEKSGQFWSCPPFETPALERFPAWTHGVLVCQKTWLAEGTTKELLIERFLETRARFGAMMTGLERRQAGTIALIAGHCSGCGTCTRAEGKACRTPERLRYSLEAVGFDVTGLAEGLAGQKLHWPKSGLPDYLMTVGTLLCPDRAGAERVLTERIES